MLLNDFFLAIWIFEQRFFEGRIFHKNEIRLMAKVKGVYTSSWYLITDVFPIFCEGIFSWIKDMWESNNLIDAVSTGLATWTRK